MHTLKTPHAIVHHHSDWSEIQIELKDPNQPLDIMDIKEIYAAFFFNYIEDRLEELKPDDIIRLGSIVGKNFK